MDNKAVDNLWSTSRIEKLLHNFKKTGVLPMGHPFFQRKIGKRKSGLNFGYSTEEILELLKCQEDVIYFAENFCKISTKKGKKLVGEVGGLREYQKKILRQFQANKYNIVLASRQIGKSITVAIYVCWFILFGGGDSNVLLLSETGKKAKDLFSKIKDIQDNMPFYMQVGLEYSSTQRRIYENGCSIHSENTTENTGVSGTFQFVYWDEMALLDAEMQEKIFTGVFPTMAQWGDSAKFIITSTPRGRHNKFYNIWSGAIAEPDSPNYLPFAYSKVYWYEVPEHNTPEWVEEQKKIMGEVGFAREYDLSFDADEDMLLEDTVKKAINAKYQVYPNISGRQYDKIFKIRPDYDVAWFSEADRRFHISIDLASGKKRDYTVFTIFEIVPKTEEDVRDVHFFEDERDFFKQVQVAVVRSNMYKPEIMARYLHEILQDMFIADNVRISIEMNHKGDFFLEKLFAYKADMNFLYGRREEVVIEYPLNFDFDADKPRLEEGIIQNVKTKKYSTDNINFLIESHSIEISESVTIEEGLSFGKDKKGNMKGLGENDDCFMTVLNATAFFKTDEWADFVNDVYEALYPEERRHIDLALFGESGDSDGGSDDIY